MGGASSSQGVYHLGFVVQSAKVDPIEITRRIETFLTEATELVANTTPEQFADFVVAAQERLLEPPKRLSSVADDEWSFISERSYRFSWPRRVATALSSVRLSDVKALLVDSLKIKGNNGGRLLVQVYGNNATLASPPEVPEGYSLVEDAAKFRSMAKYWP